MNYQHVLVAVDLSQESDLLIETAKRLSGQHARLSIVHVQEYTPIIYGGGEFSVSIDANLEETLRKRAEESMAVLAKKHKLAAESLHIKVGPTSEAIVELAQYLKADLVVLGNHERSGLSQWLSATAQAVMHHIQCDVYTVYLAKAD